MLALIKMNFCIISNLKNNVFHLLSVTSTCIQYMKDAGLDKDEICILSNFKNIVITSVTITEEHV